MSYARKVDDNQAAVVAALRRIGAEVTHLHSLGHGVADLLVSHHQVWYVIEIKDGNKPKSARALTPDEQAWIGRQHAPVFVVNSPEEAVGLLTLMNR